MPAIEEDIMRCGTRKQPGNETYRSGLRYHFLSVLDYDINMGMRISHNDGMRADATADVNHH